MRAGRYNGPLSVGGDAFASDPIKVLGEDGVTVVTVRKGSLQGFSINGNAVVRNVDVGGHQPFINLGGENSTWEDSRLLRGSNRDTAPGARGTGVGATPEPVLIYSDDETAGGAITNVTIRNVVFEPQYVCTPGTGTCPSGDPYHLETIRIDQNVDGVLIDRVTFQDGGEDNTALIFITAPNPATSEPRNITIQNSVFGDHQGSYNLSVHGNVGRCTNYVFAYNTHTKERAIGTDACAGNPILHVGNAGPKSPNGINCTSGTTWRRNVWQWAQDPRICDGESRGDTWVAGPDFSSGALGLDAHHRPRPGSPLIDAGEPLSATDYCTDPAGLGGVDRDGHPRGGDACDAGAFEAGS